MVQFQETADIEQNQINQPQKQSKCIWYDEENNKYYILNNQTGQMKKVFLTGDYIKEFDASLTGSVNYKERVQRAKENLAYMPYNAKSLKYNPDINYYTPAMDKFINYAQFPQPRVAPYYNQRVQIKLNKRKQEYIENVEKCFEPQNSMNQTLFKFKKWKDKGDSDVGVLHLTGTLKDFQDAQESKKIQVLQERKVTKLLSVDEQEKMMNEQKIEKLMNSTKIINKRIQKRPNLNQFERQMTKLENQYFEQIEKEEKGELELKKIQYYTHHRIDEHRYRDKVNKYENKTFVQLSNTQDELEAINNYTQAQEQKDKNLTNLYQSINFLQTNTFDKSIKLNLQNNAEQSQQIITKEDQLNKLKRQKEEFEGFRLPQDQNKKTIVTKGRFNSSIPSNSDQFINDRAIQKQVNPQLYEDEKKKSKNKRYFIDPITKQNIPQK